jgi:hypothetical protein
MSMTDTARPAACARRVRPLDLGIPGGRHEELARRGVTPAVADVQDVDRQFVQPCVHQILDAPAGGALQFLGLHRRRLDLKKLRFVERQQGRDVRGRQGQRTDAAGEFGGVVAAPHLDARALRAAPGVGLHPREAVLAVADREPVAAMGGLLPGPSHDQWFSRR